MRRHFFGVRHDPVNYFQAVNVGGVFLHAAQTIYDRRRNECQNL